MDALTDQVGAVVGGIIGHPLVQLFLAGLAAYIVVLWLATAFWTLNDMRRRTLDPAIPFVASAAMVLASPLLFPLAVVVYRIVRPGETLAEARERQLTEAIEDAEAAERLACPGCARWVEESWLICPACRMQLAHRCAHCGETVGMDWTLCAWCGQEFGRTVLPEGLPHAVREAAARTGRASVAGTPRTRVLEPGA